ncbi:MAG: hypothetical protein AB7V32_09285 [Candidatus Berkiella sp.]
MSDNSKETDQNKIESMLYQFKTVISGLKQSHQADQRKSSILENITNERNQKGIGSEFGHTNHIHNDSHTDHSESRPMHDKNIWDKKLRNPNIK